jgi:hypothetical protein
MDAHVFGILNCKPPVGGIYDLLIAIILPIVLLLGRLLGLAIRCRWWLVVLLQRRHDTSNLSLHFLVVISGIEKDLLDRLHRIAHGSQAYRIVCCVMDSVDGSQLGFCPLTVAVVLIGRLVVLAMMPRTTVTAPLYMDQAICAIVPRMPP